METTQITTIVKNIIPKLVEGTIKNPKKYSITEAFAKVEEGLTSNISGQLEVSLDDLEILQNAIVEGLRKVDFNGETISLIKTTSKCVNDSLIVTKFRWLMNKKNPKGLVALIQNKSKVVQDLLGATDEEMSLLAKDVSKVVVKNEDHYHLADIEGFLLESSPNVSRIEAKTDDSKKLSKVALNKDGEKTNYLHSSKIK